MAPIRPHNMAKEFCVSEGSIDIAILNKLKLRWLKLKQPTSEEMGRVNPGGRSDRLVPGTEVNGYVMPLHANDHIETGRVNGIKAVKG